MTIKQFNLTYLALLFGLIYCSAIFSEQSQHLARLERVTFSNFNQLVTLIKQGQRYRLEHSCGLCFFC